MAEFPWPAIKTASSFPFIGWFGLGSKTDIHLLKHFFSRESVTGEYYKDFQYFNIYFNICQYDIIKNIPSASKI